MRILLLTHAFNSLDQRLFVVSGDQAQTLLELLERPAEDNAGLRDLFTRPEPWETT